MASDAATTYRFEESASEQSDAGVPEVGRSCRRTAVGSMAGLAALAGVVGLRHIGASGIQTQGSIEPIAAAEEKTMRFPKPTKMCSTWKEDCADTGCCKTTGHTCWKKDEKTGHCKQDCPDDWDCTDLTQTRKLVVRSPGTSMYCYALVFSTKGGKLYTPDDELLKYQYDNKRSIFACDSYEVFGDVDISFGGGEYKSLTLQPHPGWTEFTRPDTGAAANVAIFLDAWGVMREQQKWRDMEWVVKADADAVFIPARLKDMLSKQMQPDTGLYYENCKGVDSGFFGNLEVISTAGFKIFVDKLENCRAELPWDGAEVDDWKYGPWGEDKFAQECMDKAGVLKLQLFELTYDGACPADQPKDKPKGEIFSPPCWNSSAPSTHPFMSVEAWKNCYDETTKAHKVWQ